MQLLWLDDETAICGAIGPDAIPGAAEAGIRAIINNRPDGEEQHQASSDSIAAAAKQQGLDYRFVPISMRQLSPQDIEGMRAALNDTPAPRVAFCRSGSRSYILWALANAGTEAELEEMIDQAAGRGFDISVARLLAQR